MKRSRHHYSRYATFLSLFLLGACGSGPDSDLLAYVEQVKQTQPTPLVAEKTDEKHELFVYQADSDGIRDPFLAPVTTVINAPASPLGPTPEIHQPGALETMSLESLVYMGSIEKQGRRVALVRGEKGQIHQVMVGTYLGQNHGKVVGFDQHRITVRELYPDGMGGWQERMTTVGQAK